MPAGAGESGVGERGVDAARVVDGCGDPLPRAQHVHRVLRVEHSLAQVLPVERHRIAIDVVVMGLGERGNDVAAPEVDHRIDARGSGRGKDSAYTIESLLHEPLAVEPAPVRELDHASRADASYWA